MNCIFKIADISIKLENTKQESIKDILNEVPKYDEWSHENSYESALEYAKKIAKKEKDNVFVFKEKPSLGNGFTVYLECGERAPANTYAKVSPDGSVKQLKDPNISKVIKL